MTVVFMFPGQSARHPGMLEAPLALSSSARSALAHASELLQRDLRCDLAEDVEDPFATNEAIQVGVFVANHLWLLALADAGVEAPLSLGLSLGEYNHLVHIGALAFDDALRLVRERGRAYDQGPRGMMIAAQPVTLHDAEAAIAASRDLGVVEVVCRNAPTQQVLGGDRLAVEAAGRWLEDEVYAQPVVIEDRLPMHCSTFQPAADLFAPVLAGAPFRAPALPYLPNRLATFLTDPGLDELRTLLAEHLYRPVLWQSSVEHVHDRWPDALFLEVGPGRQLAHLVKTTRRAARHASVGRRDVGPARFAEVARLAREAADV